MSLARWSHSSWYIYEVWDSYWRVEISWFGNYSVVDILRNYTDIDDKAKREGYSLYDRIELFFLLYPWALFKMQAISKQRYNKINNFVYVLGQCRTYVKNPYNVFGLPKFSLLFK